MARNDLIKANNSTNIVLGDRMPNTKDIPRPPTSVRSLTAWLFVTGFALFGGLGFWAASAQLNSAVIANGKFEVDGNLKTVQHLAGGIVTAIHVKEGDYVSEGDVVAQLDETRSLAQRRLLKNQLAAALGRKARLVAEFQGSAEITLGQELQNLVAADQSFAEGVEGQQTLFASNRKTDQGQVAILQDRVDQLHKQTEGVRDRLKAQQDQLQLVEDELADVENLYERGLSTRIRVLAEKRIATQLNGSIGESNSELFLIEEQISEYRERILQVERDRKMAIADDLQVLHEQVIDVRQRLAASEKLSEQLTIRAPISGRIVGFDLNTVGAVIQSGQDILRIVPEGSDFIVRGRVFPGDIDEVLLGATVRIRLSAYSYRKTPPILGVVTYVSADTVLDETTGEWFFEVTAEIPEESYAKVPEVEPVPSMPVQLFISTGKQTVLAYLLNPVLGGLETAMLEND